MRVAVTSVGATEILVGLAARSARLQDLHSVMETASDEFYEETRRWYDSGGDGSWPPLAESTVARKASQGAAAPRKMLYDEGNLFESATSPNGPYSNRIIDHHSALMQIDWDEGGWQIPMIQSFGAGAGGRYPSGGNGPNWRIPARPIWPQGAAMETIRHNIGQLILRGV